MPEAIETSVTTTTSTNFSATLENPSEASSPDTDNKKGEL